MSTEKNAGPVKNWQSNQSLLHTVPYQATRITSGFWANYQYVNRTVSLAHGFAMLEKAGNFHNLRLAIGTAEGTFMGYWFADSDVYKWLEAVGWELGRAGNSDLEKMADEAITLLEQAQQADGYLNSYYQVTAPEKRWTDLDHGHELYCAGHLIQAAVAFHRAVGDDRLLTIALKFVDHINEMFGANGRVETCGHPEIEMALVELYRTTDNTMHLELAQLFIDRRGQNKMRGHAGYGPTYQQDHVPVREAAEVAGHAVRQLYLTTGVTDLYMETGEQALLDAMHRLWADMTQRKLYATGGIGSRFDGEAFGSPYELPSDTGYCETCAAIASLMWNWRLLLITGHSRYADLFEQTLYNGLLSSPGLEGQSYLYVNPLHVRSGRYVRASADTGTGEEPLRPTWHNCACCPPNVMRLFSSLNHYIATINTVGVQLHQFATTQLELDFHGEPLKLAIESNYPWEGQISIKINESPVSAWALALRIPRWCRKYSLSLNGTAITPQIVENGYLTIARPWQNGDVLVFDLQMTPTFIAPNPRVDALRGCVALQRGPLLYCFESHDQAQEVDLLDVQVLSNGALETATNDILGGIQSISVPAHINTVAWGDALYRPLDELPQSEWQPTQLTAIPYYAWGNRGMQSMRIWVPKAN